jgi:molybdopterin-guanine dinucleotide biosynthesis protein A
MKFSAVILAGGNSSRMGRDKAFLELSGQSLLARQIALVRQAGATEIFISGRAGVDYAAFGCPVLKDAFPDGGPLAGIASAFQTLGNPLLLVLAVDMPNLGSEPLQRLQAGCRDGLGAVPMCGDIVEPLAAFYPRAATDLLQKCLGQSGRTEAPGVGDLARACVQAGLAHYVVFPPGEAGLFKSWNHPADLPAMTENL